MEFGLLGPLEVWDGDRPLPLGGSKRRALLALLVLNANEVVRTERLADELWGERAPGNAVASIHNHVSRLRKELGSQVLVTHRWGYALRTEPETIDLARFERARAAAEALPAAQRAAALAEALSLWRGSPLADLAGEQALAKHIARLDEHRLVTLEQRIDADLEAGRSSGLVAELEALIADNPLREHFRWQLILALYRSGRQAEALEVYRETRRLLVEELGLEPGPELRALEGAILRQDPALAAPDSPVAGSGPERTHRIRRRVYAALAGLVVSAGLAAGAYTLTRQSARTAAPHTTSAARYRSTGVAAQTAPAGPLTQPRSARPLKHGRTRRVRAAGSFPPVTEQTRPTRKPSPAQTTSLVATGSPSRPAHVTHHVTPAPEATETTTDTPAAAAPSTVAQAGIPTTGTTTAAAAPAPPAMVAQPGVLTLGDTAAWWTSANQNALTVTRSAAQVTVDVPFDATDGFNASVTTRCRAEGDFDARVSFDLEQWPGSDGIWVSLMAADLGGVNTYRTDAFGQTYGTYIPPNSGPPPLPASGSSGTLRLTRQGALITGSYLAGSTWVPIASQSGPTAGTEISLSVFNGSDVAPFGRRAVTVSFSDFTLVAQRLDC